MTHRRPILRAWWLAALVSTAVAFSGCTASTSGEDRASSTGDTGSSSHEGTVETGVGDITPYCGTKPTKVAYLHGAGNGTAHTLTSYAELKDEAAKCSNITEVRYLDGQGDQQKALSDINSAVALGVNVIVLYAPFGAAELPTIRAAYKKGVQIVEIIGPTEGVPGQDLTAEVLEDPVSIGQKWAEWLNATVKEGNVVYLGGVPGASSSTLFFDGLKSALAKYPKLHLVPDNFVPTSWDAGQKKQAMAGLYAKYGDIAAVVSDYATTDTGVVSAAKQAGEPIPAIASLASSNGIGCEWAKEPFPFLSLDGTTSMPRLALRIGIAAYQGIANDEPSNVSLTSFIDTEAGKDPKCDPSLPADADLSSTLPMDTLKEVLGGGK